MAAARSLSLSMAAYRGGALCVRSSAARSAAAGASTTSSSPSSSSSLLLPVATARSASSFSRGLAPLMLQCGSPSRLSSSASFSTSALSPSLAFATEAAGGAAGVGSGAGDAKQGSGSGSGGGGGSGGSSGGGGGIGVYVFGGLTAITASLGVWQLRRYVWKKDLLQSRASELLSSPIDLSDGTRDAEVRAALEAGDALIPVVVRGAVFGTSNYGGAGGCTVRIEPRTAPADIPTHLSTLSFAQAGYSLVTPLQRAAAASSAAGNAAGGASAPGPLLVLRGWAPADAPSSPPPSGPVTVTGFARRGERRGTFAPKLGEQDKAVARDGLPLRSILDPADIAAAAFSSTGSSTSTSPSPSSSSPSTSPPPILIEAVSPWPERTAVRALSQAGQSPWPITRQSHEMSGGTLPATTHLVYSATWLTLAAFGAFITARRFGVGAKIFSGGRGAGRRGVGGGGGQRRTGPSA